MLDDVAWSFIDRPPRTVSGVASLFMRVLRPPVLPPIGLILVLLAACIIALASPASARPWGAFHCGKTQIALIPQKYFDPESPACKQLCDGKEHYYDMKKDPKNEHPLPNRLFRSTPDGLFYKGKLCRALAGDEY